MATTGSGGMDGMGQLPEEMYRIWERSMTEWWDQVLDSNAFLKTLGENLSTQTQARSQYERSVDETLTRMHLPTRSDLTRLARISSLLEERLLKQEDLLLEMTDRMALLEKEALQARIEATEARLELRERLAELQGQLAASSSSAAPESGPSEGARARRAASTPPPSSSSTSSRKP